MKSFSVGKFEDIYNIIIPFFDKYPVKGVKYENFLCFKEIADIVKTKNHLTPEGITLVKKIRSNMNNQRVWKPDTK